ncbi:MAG: CBS domain-containing protein [Calditrichaeota bacterium]|nr:MAG: CBS domain-containing protein [Calditrichota bacterium]
MKTVGDLIKDRETITVSPDMTVLEATRLMAEKHIGAVPVIKGDKLLGIFSERDLMTRVIAPNLNPETTRVKEVMTRELVVVEKDESYDSCLHKMKESNIRHLPIISDNKFVGIISLRDLLTVDIENKDHEIRQLHHFIHYVPPAVEV